MNFNGDWIESMRIDQTEFFAETLKTLEHALLLLSRAVPSPKLIDVSENFPGWRYLEQLPQQAIVIKLARLLSALHAAKVLLDAGLVLDVGASKRIIDEITEDVIFISSAVRKEDQDPKHIKFLREFWQEEFDPEAEPELKNLARDRLPRNKVRANNSKLLGGDFRTHAQEVIDKTYSGYVHGASGHTMEIFGGRDFKFNFTHMKNTPPWNSQQNEMPNYFHRAICTFGIAADVIGDANLFSDLIDFRARFEKLFNMNFE
jgi:hypothetical protein